MSQFIVLYKIALVCFKFGSGQSVTFDAKVIYLAFISLIAMGHHNDKMEKTHFPFVYFYI
jgi:hypothetical protein